MIDPDHRHAQYMSNGGRSGRTRAKEEVGSVPTEESRVGELEGCSHAVQYLSIEEEKSRTRLEDSTLERLLSPSSLHVRLIRMMYMR